MMLFRIDRYLLLFKNELHSASKIRKAKMYSLHDQIKVLSLGLRMSSNSEILKNDFKASIW